MKKTITLLMTLLLIVALTACSGAGIATVANVNEAQSPIVTSDDAAGTSAEAVIGAGSVAEALAENSETHDDAGDYVWESSAAVPIILNGNSITADGDGVTVEGSTATITSAGTYRLSGALADGQIIVNTDAEGVVRLIFSGVDIRNSTSAPINIVSAEKTVIVLADGAENYVSDGASYVFEDPAEDEPNAAIFSKSDLTIYGNGSLTVNGNYNDGIASKDGLIIASGAITVNAADDGLRGKDYLVVESGSITVNAQGDGLKSDNEEDAAQGYISIEAGVINITSGGDAIQAQTDVMIADGEFNLVSGGGSSRRIDEAASAKGIKATVNVAIDGGTFTINSADDAIHSNASLTINGGVFSISTGDDGLHADSTLDINGGEILVAESYEGVESAVITINAGAIHVVSSDDGINVAGGNDGSGMNQGFGPGGRPGMGPGQDAFTYSGSYYLYIHGGYIVVEAAGDGIDVNGAIEMTEGIVLVSGPTEQMNGAVDYDAWFNMTGGFLVAAGSSGMAQAPGASSSQSSVLIYLTSAQPAGTLVHIQNSAGENILTFAPAKEYQSIAVSSPGLVNGATYELYIGGSSTGAVSDGLYQDGTYAPGAQYTSFTISGMATTIGTGGNRFRP
jgi:hypothetical protein